MRRSSTEALSLSHVTDGLAPSRMNPWPHPIKRLAGWIRNEREIGRAINTLMALDDHMLADIGLKRTQVKHAARHGRPSRG